MSGSIVLYCNVFRICCRMNNINQRKYMSLPIWKSKFPPQLENKSKFLAHLKSPFSSMKRNAPSGNGEQEKWLMFCLLFLTPCSRNAMAIAGFKVNQSNFGQTSLSSQSWVVTSNQSVQNGRTVQNYLVSWKKKCIQHHLRLGKGSKNQNGNLRWHLPWRGGGLEGVLSATYLFWKMIFVKNHLESFPDCENVFCT